MKKKLLFLSLALMISLSGVAYAANKWGSYKGSQIIRLTVDGTPVKVTDVPAVSLNQRTMIPIYLLSQAGVKFNWDQANQTVNIVKPVEAAKDELAPYLLDMIAERVYKVLGSTDDPKTFKQGSGFIYNGYMITNAHVAGESAVTQVTVDGVVQKITQYKFVNKDIDLMGFKVTGGNSLPLSTEFPKKGDVVYDISYPHGELKVTEGKVHFISTENGKTEIVHSAQIDSGSSGGILLNGKGELVGVNRSGGGEVSGEVFSWAIPIQYVVDELNQ